MTFLKNICLILFSLFIGMVPNHVMAQQSSVIMAEFIFDTASFAQCHASTIAESHGDLVAAWFGGTAEKNPDVEIWLSRKENNHWSVPVSVANGIQNDGKRYPCWNPVLFQVPDGPLLLFYKVGPSPDSWWGELKRSPDGGTTWSTAEHLPEGILGPIKDKPVLLPDKTLLCGSSTEDNGWKIHFERTADQGKTWIKTESIPSGKKIQIIQPSILIYPGNRLQALCRSKEGSIMSTWSDDMGRNWSDIEVTELPNPNSGIDAVTLKSGYQLLVYNHASVKKGNWGGPRSPLNVAMSPDGIHWSSIVVLEDQDGEFSYPAVIQTSDGMIHITYTWKRKKIKHVVLDPAKFKPRPMTDGTWQD